jgi:hypothetical protein
MPTDHRLDYLALSYDAPAGTQPPEAGSNPDR